MVLEVSFFASLVLLVHAKTLQTIVIGIAFPKYSGACIRKVNVVNRIAADAAFVLSTEKNCPTYINFIHHQCLIIELLLPARVVEDPMSHPTLSK